MARNQPRLLMKAPATSMADLRLTAHPPTAFFAMDQESGDQQTLEDRMSGVTVSSFIETPTPLVHAHNNGYKQHADTAYGPAAAHPAKKSRRSMSQIGNAPLSAERGFVTETSEDLEVQEHGNPDQDRKKSRRKRATRKNPNVPLRLRINTPLQQALPMDVWRLLFSSCNPKILLQLNLVCKDFQILLGERSIWNAARHSTFGADHPDPPPGMSEMQYAKLLTGVGCQSSDCSDRRARAVYWAFGRRWCEICLQSNTIDENSVKDAAASNPSLLGCLPKAHFDSWGRYGYAGEYVDEDIPTWVSRASAYHVRYSRSSYENLLGSLDELKRKDADTQTAWWTNEVQTMKRKLKQIQVIEGFMHGVKVSKQNRAKTLREERESFFVQRAENLLPPLSLNALKKISKFDASLAIPKPPTERSWRLLLPKLCDERKAAEKIVHDEVQSVSNMTLSSVKIQQYESNERSRYAYTLPVQKRLLRVADIVIQDVRCQAIVVAVSDLVPFLFHRIYKEYEKLGSKDVHLLLLDDARTVYRKKILPFLNETNERHKATQSLKCPGCKRRDLQALHTFEDLMRHICERHLTYVGDFDYFRVPSGHLPHGVTVPWFCVRWPANLPILAKHRTSNGRWDPMDNSEYQHELEDDT